MKENISWEGHLGGAISGMVMAFVLINKGPQKPEEDIAKDDDDIDDQYPYWLDDDSNQEPKEDEKEEPETNAEPAIKFRYVPKNANPWEKDD
jgi:hypothetical protein